MSSTATSPATPRTRASSALAALRSPLVIAALIAIVLVIIGQLVSPGFAAPGQIIAMLRVASFLGIIAIGQTIVILSGGAGIDLSVGTTATLAAIIGARLMAGTDANLLAGIGIPLLAGALVGALNAIGILWMRIPPFVMTLGMSGVVTGATLAYTGGAAAGRSAPALTSLVNGRGLLGVPGVILVWIALIVLVTLYLRRTAPGWDLYAVGSGSAAARLSGVPVARTVAGAYIASGVFAAVGGLMLLGYTESVFLNLANGYTLPAVAAVIIGGTLATGGIGGYAGTAIGAVVLTVLTSLLTTMNIPESWRTIINGTVLLALLAVYGRQRRLRA